MSVVEEGFEAPIDNFVFRQCPAEFKLKTTTKSELPAWTANSPSKTSLLQICHEKGIILFPHHEKGALAFAPIKNLAEKDKLVFDSLTFPGDESSILSLCLDPSERFIFVGKASKKLYAVDLAKDSTSLDKRPFVSKISQLDSAVVDCIATEEHGLFVLLETGKLLNFHNDPESLLQESDFLDLSAIKQEIYCISQAKVNGLLALGFKETSEILLIKLNEDREEDEKVSIETISVPWEELGCGQGGVTSIFMFADGNSALFACKPDNAEADDVPLLLMENIVIGEELRFSFYFDPCASRPPRLNQFYFLTLPIAEWSDNLADFVVLGNYSSPDLGVCGRLSIDDEFQTFYIDNDEGLAQLPFVNGKAAYPVGMALDLSSTTPLEHLNDPDSPKYPPAPIVWVLTDTAQLCPFYLLKIDETRPHSFMRQIPDFKISEFVEDEDSNVEVVEVPKTPVAEVTKTPVPTAQISSTPQTPSKVPLQHLASLQKSTEIKPIEPFNFKPAPALPVAVEQKTDSVKKIANTNTVMIDPEPVLVKKIEKMESINVGAYQNILLAEIAATHVSMQDDLFTLKQLSAKNAHLLRQNSQKYFNSLESLEIYAVSLENLLGSSEKVFASVKERVDALKNDLKELLGKTKHVKSNWNRIKQDNKIDWDARVQTLSIVSQDLIERIERVRSFTSNPVEASKYRATLKSFVDSAQEKVQLLMAHISGLFVSDNDDISTLDLGSLSLSPSLSLSGSADNLLDQLNVLSLQSRKTNTISASKKHSSLLNAVKARGARLLIPNKIIPVSSPALDSRHLKLSSADESLISSFISAVRLTEEVPDFPEIAVMAKLSLEEKPVAIEKPVILKPIETIKPFEFKSVETAKPIETAKPVESKAPETVKPFEFKTAEIAKPFEFKKPEIKKPAEAETKTPETAKPFMFNMSDPFKPVDSPVTKPFEFKISPETAKPTVETAFSFSSVKSEEPILTESTTKIPSIFTAESILKKESPLPTFDSLNFGGLSSEKKTEESAAVKPFPSIFGVKSIETEKDTVDAPQPTSPAFAFSFNPEAAKEPVKVVEPAKEVEKEDAAKEVTATSSPSFSFSFGPSTTATTEPSTSDFSITAKPTFPATSTSSSLGSTSTITTFGQTSVPITSTPSFGITATPTFGQTSIPPASTSVSTFSSFGQTTAPAFGQTSKPAFGQTSLPTATGFSFANAPASVPLSSSGSSGFAAFASSTSAGNVASFSSFAAPAATSGNGLTFATFLPDSQKEHEQKERDNKQQPPATSTFSFTGFRE